MDDAKTVIEKSRHAFVTFVMRNDSFVPGAMVFAYALRKQNTSKDLVCIVSEHVSEEAIITLKFLYDKVIVINEIYVPHDERHERQDRPFLFTRFHALRLGKDGDLGCDYEKIVIADADLLPIQKYDNLFDVDAPAGVINEKKEHCLEHRQGQYVIPDSVYVDGTWNWHRIYQDYPLGVKIPQIITDRVQSDRHNMGVNAALYVFTPSMQLFKDILKDINDPIIQQEIAQYPWPEMQYITYKLSGQWHNLDLRYSSFNGYPILEVLYGIHYAGLKPWKTTHRSIYHFAKNEDYRLWYALYVKMMQEHEELQNNRKMRKLYHWITRLIEDHRYQFHRKYLPIFEIFFKS